MDQVKKLPEEWEKEFGVKILDPDGWDRTNFAEDWSIPLTELEFHNKAFMSTVQQTRPNSRGFYDVPL